MHGPLNVEYIFCIYICNLQIVFTEIQWKGTGPEQCLGTCCYEYGNELHRIPG